MQGLGSAGESCPFEFNFDAATFKVGDLVSYRVSERFGEMPFVGKLIEVHADYVVIEIQESVETPRRMKGTRESRPEVTAAEALG